MARLAACRTRRSYQGDFGSHWSGRSSQKVPCDSLDHCRLQGEPGGLLQLLGQLATDRVRDVHLSALECGEPRGLVGDHPQHQPLHGRALAPVLLEGLQHQLDPGREGDELVGARAHRRLLEALVAHLLHVLARHDPARAGGVGVEGQEVGPGLLQADAHPPRIGGLHAGHALLQRLDRGAAVALQRELHVVRRDRVAVVEERALAEHELVHEPVLRDRPGFGQPRRPRLPGHGLHQSVVQGVEDHVGRDHPRGLRRVEPRGCQRDVHGPGELALGRGRQSRRKGEDEQGHQDQDESAQGHGHASFERRVRTGKGGPIIRQSRALSIGRTAWVRRAFRAIPTR